MFNAADTDLNDYARRCLVGDYHAWYNPDVSIITQKTSRIGWDDAGQDTWIHLRFRAVGFEPIGTNKLWYAYQWFDPEEDCIKNQTCLDYSKIEGRLEPFEYWTTFWFSDTIERSYIINAYWFLFA